MKYDYLGTSVKLYIHKNDCPDCPKNYSISVHGYRSEC